MADLAPAGGLLADLRRFAALYVLTPAVAGPLLAKYSEAIFDVAARLFVRLPRAGRADSAQAPH